MRRPLAAVFLCLFVTDARADEKAEAESAAALRDLGCTVEADDKAPGKPVVRVDLFLSRVTEQP